MRTRFYGKLIKLLVVVTFLVSETILVSVELAESDTHVETTRPAVRRKVQV